MSRYGRQGKVVSGRRVVARLGDVRCVVAGKASCGLVRSVGVGCVKEWQAWMGKVGSYMVVFV